MEYVAIEGSEIESQLSHMLIKIDVKWDIIFPGRQWPTRII